MAIGREGGADRKETATHAARLVLSWLRGNHLKRLDDLKEDGDEGEAIDDEAFLYDMRSVEELARGDEGWRFKEPKREAEDEGNAGKRVRLRAMLVREYD